MGIRVAQEKFDVLPTGDYLARVGKIEQQDGTFGPQLKFVFDIVRPEQYAGVSVLGWASKKFSTSSKLFKWTRAILFSGADIPADYDLDTDDLHDRSAVLTVVVASKEDGSEYNRVTGLRSPKSGKPQPATQQPTAQPVPQPMARVSVPPATEPPPIDWDRQLSPPDDEEMPF